MKSKSIFLLIIIFMKSYYFVKTVYSVKCALYLAHLLLDTKRLVENVRRVAQEIPLGSPLRNCRLCTFYSLLCIGYSVQF